MAGEHLGPPILTVQVSTACFCSAAGCCPADLPPVITFARSLPESLFILAPRAHADVVEQSCL